MPIRKDLKPLYPKNWNKISAKIKAAADYKCQNCGIQQYAVAYWDKKKNRYITANGNVYLDFMLYAKSYGEAKRCRNHLNDDNIRGRHYIVVVLTTAHLDHNPTNNTPTNLRCLCARCHLAHDQKHHLESRVLNKRCKETLELPL